VAEQFATACLVASTLIHAPAQDVQFGFAHRAFEQCAITHSRYTSRAVELVFSSVAARLAARSPQ
jgi:hypothetical protein